ERPPSWWAMVLVCAAGGTLFASLLFGGLFLWLVAPAWPPPLVAQPSLTLALFAAVMGIGASVSGRLAVCALRRQRSAIVMLRLAGVAQAAGFATFLLMALQVPDPTAHAHLAVIFVVLIYAAIHAGIGVILALHGLWRWHGGYLSALRSLDLRIAQ